ncbi:hypothetical protein GSI_08789 [Ganoderma sinense ZZ0214-1]|uniref:Uncharacterized protein n=1 Tax=Ganoderma sinense ZZ0214-1 TaxID=1077348 RepID=A0A2G8S4S6_9APHY|nr:hypothetical protein GSI_08789 [Ganoderma sinense ZZ0214-1]
MDSIIKSPSTFSTKSPHVGCEPQFPPAADDTAVSPTVSFQVIGVSGEPADLQALSGRLHALRAILGHLDASLTSLNESHRFVNTQVRDLEEYISGLAITANCNPPGKEPNIGIMSPAEITLKTSPRQDRSSLWKKICNTFVRSVL